MAGRPAAHAARSAVVAVMLAGCASATTTQSTTSTPRPTTTTTQPTTSTPTTTRPTTTTTTRPTTSTPTTTRPTTTTAPDRWVEQCGPVADVTVTRIRSALDDESGPSVVMGASVTAAVIQPNVPITPDAPVGRLVAVRLSGPGIDDGVVGVWIVGRSGALRSLNPIAAAFSAAPQLDDWNAWRADWERLTRCLGSR